MGFISFAGRVLFSAIFIFAAWQKITDFGNDGGGALKAMEPKLKHLLMIAIGLEGIGGILFTFGSSLGAYLLLIFLAVVTPIMHDFYNYDISSQEYAREFIQFLKNLSLFGALLYFLGMKNSASKNAKKKLAKAKAN